MEAMHRLDDEARWLSDRIRQIESSGIRRVFDLAARLRDPIDFSIGQPDFPVPEPVRAAAHRAIDEGWTRYTPTQGIALLREKVAEKLRRVNGIPADAETVLITAGSSGGIFLAFAALLDPGDEIIMTDPYFVMYPQLAAFFGARSVFVDTYPDFQLDPERVAAAITPRTKAIIINTPNNPTGAVYAEATLRALAEVADRHGLPVIADEVYEVFTYDQPHVSIGSFYPRTITLNAFSKSHALTGWRIGYATGPRAIIEKMKELQQYTFVCAPAIAQVAALAALACDTRDLARAYAARRDLIYHGLRDLFPVTRPSGAFYIMPQVPGDATAFCERALAHNLLVIPGGVFSRRNTHIRISYATTVEKIQQGLAVLRTLAAEYGPVAAG